MHPSAAPFARMVRGLFFFFKGINSASHAWRSSGGATPRKHTDICVVCACENTVCAVCAFEKVLFFLETYKATELLVFYENIEKRQL